MKPISIKNDMCKDCGHKEVCGFKTQAKDLQE